MTWRIRLLDLFYTDHGNIYYRQKRVRIAIRILRNFAKQYQNNKILDRAANKVKGLLPEAAYCNEKSTSLNHPNDLGARTADVRREFIKILSDFDSTEVAGKYYKKQKEALESIMNYLY